MDIVIVFSIIMLVFIIFTLGRSYELSREIRRRNDELERKVK